jgi:hypothetical protein
MDRKQLLCEMYSNNKLDFSGDEEELMKGAAQSPEVISSELESVTVPDAREEKTPAEQSAQVEQGEEEDDEEEDDDEMDDEAADDEESFECEDEDVEDEHEITLLKDEDTPADPHKMPKGLVNQNLNLNRVFVKKSAYPATPAIIKRKQTKAWFNSPTDSCLSPCTQKIFKNRKPL